jgi:TfoX/Sxy family transcriptional regulator of competence genes
MAYSEELAARIREAIGGRGNVSERKMFGGIAWLVGGNMAVGTLGDALMVRLSHEDAELALTEPHVGPMDFTGRPLRGFIKVDAAGIADDAALARWVDAGADHAAFLPPK